MIWVSYFRHTLILNYEESEVKALQAVDLFERVMTDTNIIVYVDSTLASEVLNRLLKIGRNDPLIAAKRKDAVDATVMFMLGLHDAGRLVLDRTGDDALRSALQAISNGLSARLFNDLTHYYYCAARRIPLFTWDEDYAIIDAQAEEMAEVVFI